MKRPIILGIIVAGTCSFALGAHAATSGIKLPYLKGQSFVLVQGYNTLPTHINKDAYALDFSQNGCDAYEKPIAAALGGTAMTVQEEGYNGGYGTEVVINSGNDLISRYAHMIPGSIHVGLNGSVRQGQVIGSVGNTGLVAGLACPAHPGTHLHFAMDVRANDGTLTAYDPEPISGYRNMTAGNWYISDNELEAIPAAVIVKPKENALASAGAVVSAAVSSTVGKVLGAYDAVVGAIQTTVSQMTQVAVASAPNIPIGGVSVSGGVQSSPAQSSLTQPLEDTSTTTTAIVVATTTVITTSTSTSSSTFTIVATTTATTTTSTLFQQLDDSAAAPFSWYDDNWYDLGNGFSGTLNSLMLEGKISNSVYFASHVSLQEFKDPNYTAMVQQFDISDNAPFTGTIATATFSGFSIPLKPYFYYRLYTIQDYQNRSVELAGTTTTATGTMMWNNFVYGVGRVESTSTFMPFMEIEGIAATSTLLPPAITTPANLTTSFDPLAMSVSLAFSTSTDPDWAENPLHYQFNYSTSTTFDDTKWGASFPISVTMGNAYLFGVRAADDFGDVSAPATTTWNFPPGFTPYKLGQGTNSAAQDFTLPVGGTLQSITVFTTNFNTGSRNPDTNSCSLSLFDDDTVLPILMAPSDNGYSGYRCAGNLTFSFASSSPMLLPNHQYQWLFVLHDGGPTAQGGVQFYGTTNNTAGGIFSDPSMGSARFVITATSGVLFAN